MPAQSLVKRICYPEAHRFSSAATRYGCEHEDKARKAFIEKRLAQLHENFTCREAGLHLSAEHPFIAASPDGIISCDCCGEGLLEVKCPFTYCDKDLPNKENYDHEAMKTFCMAPDTDSDTLELKHNHPYYYQVQAQMNVCKKPYCDFVIWNHKDLIIRRIYRDTDFFADQIPQVEHFIKYGVLPELVGKWLTRQVVAGHDGIVLKDVVNHEEPADNDTEDTMGKLVCYCNMPAHDEECMLKCANKDCAIKYFHMECLRIRCPPKGKWYCPYCRTLPKFKRGKQNKK
ncbi:uncharacterized protein [Amphiura filiformis]|uniref:uncharacterized protein n=1 Tax=Amphiura filiformis TaxID=82378 RepID=UPI003B2123F6